MGEQTAISWADDTFNPWIGCTKVSPACDGCYAEHLMATRMGRVTWGPHGDRVRTSAANWKQPLKWEREQAARVQDWTDTRVLDGRAEPLPSPRFVFCASLADVFDNAVPTEWRRDLFDLIRATPHLTWLLLTKRPGNIVKLFNEAMCPDGRGGYVMPRNAAIGCTVVIQEEANRDVPKLLEAKAALKPAFAFVSMEPLLGPVDLTQLRVNPPGLGLYSQDALAGIAECLATGQQRPAISLDWVIVGGETDQGQHKARPSDPDWFRSLRDQCAVAEVPFHFKQWGAHLPASWDGEDEKGRPAWMIDEDHSEVDWDDLGRGEYVQAHGREFVHFHHGKTGRALDGAIHDARPVIP